MARRGGPSKGSAEESQAQDRAEAVRKKAAQAAKDSADNIDADQGVDSRQTDRNKEFARRAQRTAEMSPATNHTLQTLDQYKTIENMARSTPTTGDSPGSGSGSSGPDASVSSPSVGPSQSIEDQIAARDNRGSRGKKPSNQTDFASETPPAMRDLTAGISGGAAMAPTVTNDGEATNAGGPDVSGPSGGTPDQGGPARAPTQSRDPDRDFTTPATDTTSPRDTSGPPAARAFDQGLESGDSRLANQASTLESRVLNQYPSLGRGDVAIRRDGNRLVADIEPSARRRLVQDAVDNPGSANKAGAVAAVLQDEYVGVYEDFGTGTSQKQDAVSELQVTEEETQFTSLAPAQYAQDRNPQSQQARAVDALATRTANLDFATFKEPSRRGRAGGGGLIVGGPEAGRQVTTGRMQRPQQTGQAEAEDLDWSEAFDEAETLTGWNVPFGGDPNRDELEQAVDAAGQSYSDFATTLGEGATAFQAQRTAMSPAVMFTQAFGGDVGTIAEDPVDPDDYESDEAFLDAVRKQNQRIASKTPGSRYLSSSITGAAQLGNLPGLASTGMEATEYTGEGVQETTEGDFWEFAGESVNRGETVAASAYEYASQNKAATAGMLTGALLGSYGAMSAAPKSRWLIQPGEEAGGFLGAAAFRRGAGGLSRASDVVPSGRTSRALSGAASKTERAGEVLFPNNEPVFMSEEAAIYAADTAASKLRRAADANSFRSFLRAERGQAELTGLGKTETETEDDLGVPDDDPFRVSDKRLYDPTREFGDADDPSRMIDETRTGQPLYESDIEGGIAGKGDPQTATGEFESFEENFNARIEAAQEAQARAETPRLELNLGQPQTVQERAAYQQAFRTALAQGNTQVARELQFELAKGGFESGLETGLETEQGIETDQGTESPPWEFNWESETDPETETETETRNGFETEPRVEAEAGGDQQSNQPWERDFGFTGGGGSGGVESSIGAGWYNEFITGFALGAGPRDVATGDTGGAVKLTGQRQTKAQAEGSEEIAAAMAAFSFAGLGIDDSDGGGDSWFQF